LAPLWADLVGKFELDRHAEILHQGLEDTNRRACRPPRAARLPAAAR
jgi:hypothetical protein